MTTTPPDTNSKRRIEYLPIADIRPADRNPKAHDIDLIVGLIRRYGFTNPALWDERTDSMVAGHGRVEALGILEERGADVPSGIEVADDGTWLAPVVRGWRSENDAHAEAYLIADNRSSEIGGWDNRLLTEMLEDIAADSTALLNDTGYTADDLDDMLLSLKMDSDLDDLGDTFGDPDEKDTWPRLSITVPPGTKTAYEALAERFSGAEHEKFAEMLAAARSYLDGPQDEEPGDDEGAGDEEPPA